MNEWNIGLSPWIIADGNYPHFRQGQTAEFALEFYSRQIMPAEIVSTGARLLGGVRYQIAAEVVYTAENVWVVDFGLLAYQEHRPPNGIEVGASVPAEVSLNIDPFFYMESLFKTPGIPRLVYTWRVNRITQQR